MSVIGVIADVIDEIHQAERLLVPGDIPDRHVFRHVKSLWQLLLGIDETLFDSHNYEYFELELGDDHTTYYGLTYFGNDTHLIEENIENSIGSSTESMKIVELLDQEDTENTQETSVSFKLSLLNKIRFILFEHHIVIDELFNDDKLLDQITSLIRNDILNTNDALHISSISNNTIFNDCYQECLETMLAKDSYTIDDIAYQVLNIFKIRHNVAYFFNSSILLKFNNQIISLLNRVFKKHSFVIEEIEDFYKHNPIFPILKPIYRNATLKMITNDVKDEIINIGNKQDDEHLIDKLDITLLKRILQEVTSKFLTDQDNMPVTMKWFPQIVQYYCESLINDATSDVETDLYITMIKKVTISWIDTKVDTNTFITKLCDLSLIPTAMPYTYQGIEFPTVHMRMALYTVKENIRLYETYFDRWQARTYQNIDLDLQYRQWELLSLQKYFTTWKERLNRNSRLDDIDTSAVCSIKVRNFYDVWGNKMVIIKTNNEKADAKFTKGYLVKWQKRMQIQNSEMEKAMTLYDHKLKMKYFTLWISSKLCRFIEVQQRFALKRRGLYFKVWKFVTDDINNKNLKADQFREKNMTKFIFHKWMERSTISLSKLKQLEELEPKFSLNRYFKIWKEHIELSNKENEFLNTSQELLLKLYFTQWYQLKKLTDAENILVSQSNIAIAQKYFKSWNKTYHMNKDADGFYLRNNIQSMFNTWRLKYTRKKVERRFENLTVVNFMRKWKLKAVESQYLKQKKENVLRKTFIAWFENSSSIAERLKDCEYAYPIFKTATYFDSWKNIYQQRKNDEIVADQFKEKQLVVTDKLLLEYAFESIKDKYGSTQMEKLELIRRENMHNKQQLKKYLYKLVLKKQQYGFQERQADDFYEIGTKTSHFDTWLGKFDRVSELNEILNNKLETDNVHLLMQILSKLQLKMIKAQTDLANADKFKSRWDRIKTKTFFELWKLKLSSRRSPTPTARSSGIIHEYDSNENFNNIPDLNPYLDLEPRYMGSPLYRPPYQSKMQSVLTGNVSQYKIEQQIDGNNTSMFTSSRMTPAKFRTPIIRKANSRLLNNSASLKTTPDTNSIFTSAERVRQKNLEERVSRYRLLRSPPKNEDYKLDSVMESNDEDGLIFHDSAIFDTTENITSSTPLKKGDIIEI